MKLALSHMKSDAFQADAWSWTAATCVHS